MLKIKRKESLVEPNAPYKVFINDLDFGIIANGENKDFNLKDGDYKIKITGAGFHSTEISISLVDGQIVELECYPLYQNTKTSKFIYKNIFGGEGLSLKVIKDVYL